MNKTILEGLLALLIVMVLFGLLFWMLLSAKTAAANYLKPKMKVHQVRNY